MNNHNITTFVFCGEKGVGKSTYAKSKWPKNVVLQCNNPLNKTKTASVLENALFPIYQQRYADISEMIFALRIAVSEGRTIIVDCAESIDTEILIIVINMLIPINSTTLVFTFDIDVKYLYQSEIFRLLIEWDFVSNIDTQQNFFAPYKDLETIIVEAFPNIKSDMLLAILEISNHNFNSLKRLIWLIRNKQNDLDKLSTSVIIEYTYIMIEEKFSDIPKELFDVLKKSSVIGEIFHKCVLESQRGFHISGVKTYLEELETMNLFIHSYVNNETYQFISDQIYAGVLKCIEPKQKIAWEQILLNYYLEKLKSDETNNEILEDLLQIKRLSVLLNENSTVYFANRNLLYQYSKLQDIGKSLTVLDELIQYCKDNTNDCSLYHYFCFYRIRINMKIGTFTAAIDAIQIIKTCFPYANSLYLQYYFALCLYGDGDVDQSYTEILDLIQKLAPTSAKAVENQPIYALSYSLMSTLQYHFGIEDCGNKYYALALNHSLNKLQNKSTYYEILKKCDMYFAYIFSKPMLLESINFFENNRNYYDAAEVYSNLASEMMFNENESFNKAMAYFQKALKIFENIPNWKLAYVKNNLAILYILYKGDFETAASLLEDALLVGMSSFTYFTIYLNLCMCYLLLRGHESTQFCSAYSSFNKYHELIASRKNATQYDDIYKQIVELIILEHSGHADKANARARSILPLISSSFFIPILRDIIKRTDDSDDEKIAYLDNVNLYTSLNKYKAFLAEFRFWE